MAEEDRKHFEETQAKAEQGDAEAQYGLGICYYDGLGVTKNAVEAVKWFRKAAEQNDAEAQEELGGCYERGEGVAKDEGEAVKWFRKAAEQNSASAQYVLGIRYNKGQGVAKDEGEAVKWFRKAAEQNYNGAPTGAIPGGPLVTRMAKAWRGYHGVEAVKQVSQSPAQGE